LYVLFTFLKLQKRDVLRNLNCWTRFLEQYWRAYTFLFFVQPSSQRELGVGYPSAGRSNENYSDDFGHRWRKKWQILRSSGPCYQGCWHADWSRL